VDQVGNAPFWVDIAVAVLLAAVLLWFVFDHRKR
jgi:hypothetical protein